MTKVQAIECVLKDNGGVANLDMIYEGIVKYYPSAKDSREWEAGIRGVLYRGIRKSRLFKKIGLSIYALADYKEEAKPNINNTVKMHSYIEGICVELGNYKGFDTFSADPSALYRDNLQIRNFTTLLDMPKFSYDDVIREAQRIDVVWFNKNGLAFPQRVFEVVDSIGTLNGAFNRSLQLKNFRTNFVVVAPEKHREKYNQTIALEAYQANSDRFVFASYDEIIDLYENTLRTRRIESQIFHD